MFYIKNEVNKIYCSFTGKFYYVTVYKENSFPMQFNDATKRNDIYNTGMEWNMFPQECKISSIYSWIYNSFTDAHKRNSSHYNLWGEVICDVFHWYYDTLTIGKV